MRYVLKPSPIQVVAQPGNPAKVPFSFDDYLDQIVWSDPRWRQDGEWVDAGVRISEAIADAKDGAHVEVVDSEPDDFGKLVQVVKSPSTQIRPDLARLTLRFAQAVLRAPKDKPGKRGG